MHNHSYESECDLHVNEISFSYERMGAPRLALRKKLKVIQKWPFAVIFLLCCLEVAFWAKIYIYSST